LEIHDTRLEIAGFETQASTAIAAAVAFFLVPPNHMKNSALALLSALFLVGCVGSREPQVQPPGRDTTLKTEALELGAKVLQSGSPLDPMDVYLVGFHPMKDDPSRQMEAHHFCHQVNEDFAQCILFDGNTRMANLNGIEYIISERLFESLPKYERQYWHPHNGEILSGQLVAPGIPGAAEKELMRGKMNSYGKTWHVWATDQGDKLPVGEAMLAWSFNRDGEAKPGLMEKRDKALGINTAAIRRERQDLRKSAKPQKGVDALKGEFEGPSKPIPGVVDKDSQLSER
jgi:hypothetical protein